jgi:hypothetical protein
VLLMGIFTDKPDEPINGKAKVRALRAEKNPEAFLQELQSIYGGKIQAVTVALLLEDKQVIIAASGGCTHQEAVYMARMLTFDAEHSAFGRSEPVAR